MKRQAVTTLVMISSLVGLTACGGGGSSNNFISAPSDGTGGGGGGGTGGSVSNTGMYIAPVNQTQAVTTAIHQFGSFDTPCSIASSASPQDFNCLLNMKELDLYQQGLKLEVNVPANTCDYVADTPYSFYNREPGFGPTRVDVTVNDNAGTSSCTYWTNDGVSHTGQMSGHKCVLGPSLATAATTSAGSVTVEGAVTCAYDYSGSSGPNCCEGTYDLNLVYTPTVGATVTTNLSAKKWGGAVGKCLAGPFLDSDSGYTFNSTTGFPYTQIHDGLAGFNQYYKIKAPIKLATSRQNIYGANFYGWSNYVAGTFAAATLPLPLRFNTDRLGNPVTAPNPTYDFYCLDSAFEVKHHISLYVNEWDSGTQFTNYLSAATRSGATPIAPSANCGAFSDRCDDVAGWQWWQTNAPTSFPNLDLTSH